ncbi:MAG: hypothetical protein ABI254_03755 [Chthoniobacterales bacterium]
MNIERGPSTPVPYLPEHSVDRGTSSNTSSPETLSGSSASRFWSNKGGDGGGNDRGKGDDGGIKLGGSANFTIYFSNDGIHWQGYQWMHFSFSSAPKLFQVIMQNLTIEIPGENLDKLRSLSSKQAIAEISPNRKPRDEKSLQPYIYEVRFVDTTPPE